MHPLLNTAVKAARRAGNVIVRYIDRLDGIDVAQKKHNDFVSEVDLFAEQEIIQILKHAYPGHGILAEESGSQSGSEYEWIIDPIDGTTNFLHGNPHFAVSIAVRRQQLIEHAVIFDPLRNELFTASRGGGAHLNERRIRVSRVNRLADSLLGTGFPFKETAHLDVWLATLRALITRASGIRRAGSAALDLAYVACGRLDGFWEFGLSPWDIAAGDLLVREAGGLISDLRGQQHHMFSGDVIAANGNIHGALLNTILPLLPET